MEEKNIKDLLKDLKIKNKSELDFICDFLSDQGFGYIASYKLHDNKINRIISNNNKLKIDYNSSKLSKIYDYTDYEEANNVAKVFFSQYDTSHKIKEYLRSFSLIEDLYVNIPHIRSFRIDTNEILNLENIKRTYKLKSREFMYGSYVNIYDMDKNMLKIRFYEGKEYDFNLFYELLFNKKPNDVKLLEYGKWIDLGEIQIKRYKNNNCDIKGNIADLKKHIFDYLKSFKTNQIIVYNGQTTVTKYEID